VISLYAFRQGRTQGGAIRLHPRESKFKKYEFVYTVISKVLRDLPFSRNQLLKLNKNETKIWDILDKIK
jgi:hypothetical protein